MCHMVMWVLLGQAYIFLEYSASVFKISQYLQIYIICYPILALFFIDFPILIVCFSELMFLSLRNAAYLYNDKQFKNCNSLLSLTFKALPSFQFVG